MFDLSVEFVLLLLVVGLVVAVSGSPWIRATLLTIFGTLGFGLILLAVIGFVTFNRDRVGQVARIEVHDGSTLGIQMDGIPLDKSEPFDKSETLPPSKSSQTKGQASKTVVAKKPATAASEELPLRPAEPIRIDDQTRAEIERQWREGQLHDRLRYTGTGAATLVCLLATVFGYLKLDMLSRAKCRRGLQTGAAGVILAVALVAALAAEGRLGF